MALAPVTHDSAAHCSHQPHAPASRCTSGPCASAAGRHGFPATVHTGYVPAQVRQPGWFSTAAGCAGYTRTSCQEQAVQAAGPSLWVSRGVHGPRRCPVLREGARGPVNTVPATRLRPRRTKGRAAAPGHQPSSVCRRDLGDRGHSKRQQQRGRDTGRLLPPPSTCQQQEYTGQHFANFTGYLVT